MQQIADSIAHPDSFCLYVRSRLKKKVTCSFGGYVQNDYSHDNPKRGEVYALFQ